MTVRLIKPGKGATISYQGEVLRREAGHLLLRARWERPRLDLGYVAFEPGDLFLEHYYTEKWFNIFEVRTAGGTLKGWYCNVSRPAAIDGDTVRSEDLELDLFVAPGGREPLTLDEDEFYERFPEPGPTREAALRALGELREMARTGAPPFDAARRADARP